VRVLSIARDLQRRNARERLGLFVAEGTRAVAELLRSSFVIRGALALAEPSEVPRSREIVAMTATLRDRDIPVQEVSAAEFASAADTENPQGILALAEIPKITFANLILPDPQHFRLVLLDAVQDPGNVGTIVRTAAALGAVATVSLPGTVDLWNAKVVRSSMGALFHHPAVVCTWQELTSFLSRTGAELWGAEPNGEPLAKLVDGTAELPARLVIAVGNEGSGLSAQTRAGATQLVAVEIGPSIESLNVAVATGIMLYELRR
jgi:TrmH family RNA methyltransferase